MNPQYVAQVNGASSGNMSKGTFAAQQGVGAMRKITQFHWEPILVDSFTIIIVSDTIVQLYHKNIGQHFDSTVLVALKKLQANDLVLIFEIYGRDYGDKKVSLSPLQFRIQ